MRRGIEAILRSAVRANELTLDASARNAVKRAVWSSRFHLAAKQLARGEVAILFFHKVLGRSMGLWGEPIHSERILARQLELLTRHYEVVRLSDVVRALKGERPFPNRAVALTFDDGFRNNLLNAAPVLKRFGVPATLFVTTGFIGTSGWMWGYELEEMIFRYSPTRFAAVSRDPNVAALCERSPSAYTAVLACVEYLKRLSPERRAPILHRLRSELPVEQNEGNRFLTWDEVRELPGYGFELGAHTVTHPILTQLPEHKVEWEMLQSRGMLERETGVRPTLFSYPNGDTNAAVSAVAMRHFEAAVGTCHRTCDPDTPLFDLPRIYAPPDEVELEYVLTRLFLASPARRVKRLRRDLMRKMTS
ncbi:MAG: polysaccharide deacetylase family protein [Myxococcaceae bacterium]|nr:polysaccharide deacetylase family protein [Myxococcaceae bacterium]